MGKVFFSGIFLVMFFIGFVSAQDISLKKTYSSKKNGFSIKYPGDWEKREDVNPYIPVLLMELAEDENDIFRENVNVVVENVKNYSLEQYYEGNLKALEGGLTDFRKVDSGNRKIKNLESKWLIYLHNYQGIEVKVLVYFFAYNDKGYVITSSANPDSFDAHRNIFEAITGSFKRK